MKDRDREKGMEGFRERDSTIPPRFCFQDDTLSKALPFFDIFSFPDNPYMVYEYRL